MKPYKNKFFTRDSDLYVEGLLPHHVLQHDGVDACVRTLRHGDEELGTGV